MKREFVISRHGKDYVLYAGLLDEAHQQGLKAIRTQLIQAPTPENGNVAICFAEVTTERGTFTGIGDADPGNVNRQMAHALIRMAETRAKARALRDAVNVAMVAIEELAESAPESLQLEELEAAANGGPVSAAKPLGPAPAGIVSLASVRQQAAAGPGAAVTPLRRPAAEGAPAAGGGDAADEPPRAPAAGTRGAPRAAGAKGAPEAQPLPPTPTQLETIAKLARSVGRTVSTEGLTRAAASELITRLSEERYGARKPPAP
jgi:hypothetical protein